MYLACDGCGMLRLASDHAFCPFCGTRYEPPAEETGQAQICTCIGREGQGPPCALHPKAPAAEGARPAPRGKPIPVLDHEEDFSPTPSARLDEIAREALKWYGERAEAVHRYMTAKPPKDQALVAVMTELSLDGGRRALDAARGEETTHDA